MTADLELHVSTEEVAGGIRLHFHLHSGELRARELGSTAGSPPEPMRYTRHLIKDTTMILHGSLAAYSAARLYQFQELDDPGYAARNAPGGVEAELAGLGRELYRELFPELLRVEYGKFREQITTLLIVSDEPWIPWELVKPYGEDFGEDDFLCCQFELVRWLTGKTAAAADFGEHLRGAPRGAGVGAGVGRAVLWPQPPPPHAEGEATFFHELVGRHGGLEARVLDHPTFEQVDALLTEGGFGVLHFTGHSAFQENDPNASLFRLADGKHFRPRDLHPRIENRIRRDRPLVFFNSCEAGKQARVLTGIGGWVPRWILGCGAGAFLGPAWEVDDAQAAHFAESFYRALEEDATVAAAARQARLAVKKEFPQGSGWLAYTVYAHAQARLRLGLGPTPLWIPESHWRPEVSPPGALLRAEYGVVPFYGREKELSGLDAWCNEDSPVAVRLYTGPGGMGKTRLALELCHRMRRVGWEAGLYTEAADPATSTAPYFRALLARGKPVLAVVDYAERRRDLIVPLAQEMDRLAAGPEAGKVRLILLARAALGWWEALQKEGDGVGDFLSGPSTRWWELQPLANGPEERLTSYEKALAAFATRVGKPQPEGEPPELTADFYSRVLYLHMQALAAVEGRPLKERDDLLDYILRREQRFWEKLASERTLPASLVDGIGRAMAAFNLGGGARDEEHAIAVLGHLRHFADQPWVVKLQTARLLRDTYPGERWIEPMLPDLLGQHHTRRELQKDATELLTLTIPAPAAKE